MSKKTLILISCLVLSLTMGLGGSLAYLTDRDADANVFTMGNVDIELTEDFNQGAELMPGLDITKDVKVRNIGRNDAWVWVQIAIPADLDNSDPSQNVLHFNYSKESVGAGKWTWLESADWNNVPTTEIDEKEYKVYTVLYQTALGANEETEYSAMTKVYMDYHIDIDPDGQLYHVENGVANEIPWNLNDDGAPIIYVSAYAIQKEGFSTVEEAYAAYNKQWTTTDGQNNGLIWAEGDFTVVTNKEDLVKELAVENSSVVLNNNIEMEEPLTIAAGATLMGNGYEIESTAKYAIKVNEGSIENLILTGTSQYGIFRSTNKEVDLVLQGVDVNGPGYALNAQNPGNAGGKLEVYDSTLCGWVSYTGFDSAYFWNTYFGVNQNQYWANRTDKNGEYYPETYDHWVKPYVTTTFEECVFSDGHTIDLTALHTEGTVTFKNCYYHAGEDATETPLTQENIANALKWDVEYDSTKVNVIFDKTTEE